jgi:cytochrome bd-I ubiquinol oxidase subunit X
MWYFTWILGLGFALAFGVINAIWFEVREQQPDRPVKQRPPHKFRGTGA